MVGIPARSTLVDAAEYAREFVPYGTPCSEIFDPATQKIEILQCQLEQMQKQLAALIADRDATHDDEAPRRKGRRNRAGWGMLTLSRTGSGRYRRNHDTPGHDSP